MAATSYIVSAPTVATYHTPPPAPLPSPPPRIPVSASTTTTTPPPTTTAVASSSFPSFSSFSSLSHNSLLPVMKTAQYRQDPLFQHKYQHTLFPLQQLQHDLNVAAGPSAKLSRHNVAVGGACRQLQQHPAAAEEEKAKMTAAYLFYAARRLSAAAPHLSLSFMGLTVAVTNSSALLKAMHRRLQRHCEDVQQRGGGGSSRSSQVLAALAAAPDNNIARKRLLSTVVPTATTRAPAGPSTIRTMLVFRCLMCDHVARLPGCTYTPEMRTRKSNAASRMSSPTVTSKSLKVIKTERQNATRGRAAAAAATVRAAATTIEGERPLPLAAVAAREAVVEAAAQGTHPLLQSQEQEQQPETQQKQQQQEDQQPHLPKTHGSQQLADVMHHKRQNAEVRTLETEPFKRRRQPLLGQQTTWELGGGRVAQALHIRQEPRGVGPVGAGRRSGLSDCREHERASLGSMERSWKRRRRTQGKILSDIAMDLHQQQLRVSHQWQEAAQRQLQSTQSEKQRRLQHRLKEQLPQQQQLLRTIDQQKLQLLQQHRPIGKPDMRFLHIRQQQQVGGHDMSSQSLQQYSQFIQEQKEQRPLPVEVLQRKSALLRKGTVAADLSGDKPCRAVSVHDVGEPAACSSRVFAEAKPGGSAAKAAENVVSRASEGVSWEGATTEAKLLPRARSSALGAATAATQSSAVGTTEEGCPSKDKPVLKAVSSSSRSGAAPKSQVTLYDFIQSLGGGL